MDYQPLQYHFTAAPDAASAPTLLLLHGTGGHETDLVPLAAQLTRDYNLLGLRGNVLENGSVTRFFRRLSTGVFDEKDLRFRTHELVHFVQELAPKEGFNAKKVVALGYSNGANLAGSILLLYPDWLAGAVLWRPMLPLQDDEPAPGTVAAPEVPVLLLSGMADPYYQPEGLQTYERRLRARGFAVEHPVLRASHPLTGQDLSLTETWFQTHHARFFS
jgi:phospholipase/carboxylesterase